jgi:hypothetical protein
LTIIDPKEILVKGIEYVRFKMEEQTYEIASFNNFWNDYFIKNWVEESTRIYEITSWNMYHVIKLDYDTKETIIVNKSNNALENYNKHLNEKCSHSHPTMNDFIKIIKEDSNNYVKKLHNIKQGKEKAPKHKAIVFPTIPEDYLTYGQVPIKSSKKNVNKYHIIIGNTNY